MAAHWPPNRSTFMTERPYVVLSCAISLDGCLDSTGPDRLVLSSERRI